MKFQENSHLSKILKELQENFLCASGMTHSCIALKDQDANAIKSRIRKLSHGSHTSFPIDIVMGPQHKREIWCHVFNR